MAPKSKLEGRCKERKIDIGRHVRKSGPPEIIKMHTNGLPVAPFGLKLCQNVAPRLRIIFQALLDPKAT